MASDPNLPDTEAVASWCTDNVPGFRGPVRLEKFATGQSNPTYRLHAASGDYVLRRKPSGRLLKSAHAVGREFHVQRALSGTGVPVAHMHMLCEDDGVIGSSFYVMDFVNGRHFDDPRLPGLSPDERRALMDEMNRVLVAIHKLDLEAAMLCDFGPEGNYYRRQIDRWTAQYRASETETIPAMDDLIAWLDENTPVDDGLRTLVHGDFRIDNLLFAPDGPACAAVLDWELSTLGHPFSDLASVLMRWRRPQGPLGRGLAGVDRKALGLPEDRAFIDLYCARMGLPGVENLGFSLAFAFFRMAAILQGVKKRALDGNASNPERALEIGGHIPGFAEQGLAAADEIW
ncbi:phosphotransferase [Stappia sp. GBMRC 2046]|uniref:Phosphotransferase n=1 Tax=Stappia sediminis TaxID=2692190 RepID=A0A7X3S8Z7_9HYPH|nr:phosphotransferase family protein [Stappia sediminis]MXN66343.1 phosphotransferase [Stappia sediminis]